MSTFIGEEKRKRHVRPTNVTTELLSPEENEILMGHLGRNCYSLAAGVAQLLAARPDPDKWSKEAVGVIVLVKNYTRRMYALQLIDLEKGKIWEQVLYEDFRVMRPFSVLLTFEGDDCVFGLNFADVEEAKIFAIQLEKKYLVDQKRKNDNNKEVECAQNRTESKTETTSAGIVTQKTTTPLFRVASFSSKKKKQPLKKLDKKDIGVPTSFVHVSHVGMDNEQNFGDEVMDPHIVKILKEIGMDPKLMKRREKEFVNDFMKRNSEIMGIPPPPPPPPPPFTPQAPHSNDTDNKPSVASVQETGRSDLMAEIRQGGTRLKPTEPRVDERSDQQMKRTNTIADALVKALAERRGQVGDSDDDTDDENDVDSWEDDD